MTTRHGPQWYLYESRTNDYVTKLESITRRRYFRPMLTQKYTFIHLFTIGILSSACMHSPTQISDYHSSAPTLKWHDATLLMPTQTVQNQSSRIKVATFSKYFEPLIGQSCSDAKWNELTVKAMRTMSPKIGHTSIHAQTTGVPINEMSVGDIVFFHRALSVPQHAVIVQTARHGRFVGVTITRGKIREIFIDPSRPHSRRRKGKVINSFLRTKHPSDKEHGYLAGELIREVRRHEGLL